MMGDVLAQTPVLRPAGQPGDTILFDQFAFALNGMFINNPSAILRYQFSFDFEAILSIVGIEGVAFMDENADGIR